MRDWLVLKDETSHQNLCKSSLLKSNVIKAGQLVKGGL